MAVAGLEAEVDDGLALGEAHAELLELAHPRRRLGDGQAHDALVADAGSGDQSVAHVRLEGVELAHDGRDAALGVVGVGFGGFFFRDESLGPNEPIYAR